MTIFAMRWGDLVSPRAVFEYTFSDAWNALPGLFAIYGILTGGILVLWLIKKALEWVILDRKIPSKYVLVACHTCKDDPNQKELEWRPTSTHTAGSILHVVLELVFFVGSTIVCLFAASIAGVNLWQSAIASIGIGLIGTYVFASGLGLLGSGLFFFLMNYFVIGQWWERSGAASEGGRVRRITAFYVEFERIDKETGGALFVRVPMTTVILGSWEQNLYKEEYEQRVTRDELSGVVRKKKGLLDDLESQIYTEKKTK